MSVSRNHQCISELKFIKASLAYDKLNLKIIIIMRKKAAHLKLIERLREIEPDAEKKNC